MVGNAKEWCWNEAEQGKRYLLGGGWREPVYMFNDLDAQSAFDRSDQNGFRCVKQISDRPLDERVDAPRVDERRDYAAETPVSDAEFQAFKILYDYDKPNLDPVLESSDDSPARWRREKVAFNAAYNGERMLAIMFLPRSSKPPYQAVVFFPGSTGRSLRSSENVSEMPLILPWVENGRAVIYPILKGTYERNFSGSAPGRQRIAQRDWTVQLHKDIARSIDYLETRSDIDAGKLAFIGWSWGGAMGPIVSVLEQRLKVNVLVGGGLPNWSSTPETDPLNFAPRVTVPTLLVNGRYDFVFPVESRQVPLFNYLGTSPEHKKHVVFETGHVIPINQANAEIIAWLDHYLGPVK